MDSFYSFLKEEDEDGSIFYLFVTQNNLVYAVYFKIDEYSEYVDDFPLLLQKGFAFGFRKNTLSDNYTKTGEDLQIFSTIYEIIKDFFEANGDKTILLYHCDSSDEKQLVRDKLFNRWEKRVINTNLERHCIEVCIQEKDFYLGFITSSNNPSINDLKKEFESFSYFIIQPKD